MSNVQINANALDYGEMISTSREAHMLARRTLARRPLPRCTSWRPRVPAATGDERSHAGDPLACPSGGCRRCCREQDRRAA